MDNNRVYLHLDLIEALPRRSAQKRKILNFMRWLEQNPFVPGDFTDRDASLRAREIKVIGAGNVHYSDLLRVPLSTIDQSSTAIGRQAADMLIKSIGSKRKVPARTVLIDPILIARESTR